MTPFEIVHPGTLQEAIAFLGAGDPAVRPIAGGTALMLLMKSGLFRPNRLVSLRSIAGGLSGIAAGPDGELHIGALTPLASVEYSPLIRRSTPVIAQTLRTLSNVRVRNVATVGGHLAHADPHMDLPPVLIALGARVSVCGPAGERVVPLEAFFTGYYATALGRGELIATLQVPPQANRRAAYLKCTTRSADDWPALGIAAVLDSDGTAVREVRLAISAATPRPARLVAAEEVILREGISEAALRRAGEAAAAECEVLSDAHGTAAYKRQLVRVYVQRAVRQALAATAGSEAGPR